MANPELVTVVIPAHNEERFLGACLESVRAQDYPDLQIVVVDNASTDDTAGVVRQHRRADPRVELVQTGQLSIPVALNLGLARARGRWLVRVDAHSTVAETYVRTAVTHLRQGEWGGVGGRKDGVGVTPAVVADQPPPRHAGTPPPPGRNEPRGSKPPRAAIRG